MIIKKNFINFILIALLLTSSSCVTKALWSGKSYSERIQQVFVGQDGRYVVFSGTNYHYVLTDNSGVLKSILSLRQKGILTVDSKNTYLKLDANNGIEGYLVIEGPFSVLPSDDANILIGLGLLPDKNDHISVKIKLSGRRYAARYLSQSASISGTYYDIPVYYDDSTFAADVGKAAITPVTVTLDAVLLIGKMVILPFYL